MSFIPTYPDGTQYAAIIDTNAYGDLCPGKSEAEIIATISTLRAAEALHEIVGVGLVIAAIELISGLVSGPGTKSFAGSLNGIIAMAHHVHHDETNQPIIIPHPDLHIAQSFFEEPPSGIILRVQQVGGVIFDFKKDVSASLAWHTSKNTFQDVKSWLSAGEQEFVSLIETLIKGAEVEVRKEYPNADKNGFRQKMEAYLLSDVFKKEVAKQMIVAVGFNLNKILLPEEYTDRAQKMIEYWPLAMGFTTWVCYTVYHRNINLHSKESKASRWNWAWDQHAAFMISNDTLQGRVPFVVTGDTGLQDAIKDNGFADRVMTLEVYKQRLGLP
jgi:hypothetical protein